MTVAVPHELGIPLTDAGVMAGPRPTETLLDYTGAADDPLQRLGIVIDEPTTLEVAGLTMEFPANSILRRQDVGVLQVVRKNLGRRPIYFSVTVPDDAKTNLTAYLVREDRRPAARSADPGSRAPGQAVHADAGPGTGMDRRPRTELLLETVYRYRGLDDEDVFKDGPHAL